jgi:signal transduction histidine kinase
VNRPRLTIRARLTLLYTGLFAACGAIVIAITYGLVSSLPVDSSDNLALGSCPPDKQLRMRCEEAIRQGALHQRDTTLAHLLQYSLLTLAAMIILAALAGWIVAGRALRPVQQITEAARAASEHNLSARVSLAGPRDELRELADTFDAMLGRLQAAFDGQGRFIANAGHELRTPLTVMRATLDVVLARPAPTPEELHCMGRDVHAAIDRSERLINALLTLARNERGLIVRDEVDLATVAEDVLDATELGDRRLHISLQPAGTLGDPLLLERLVGNLVDNASRYNVAGGDLWLTTSMVDARPTLVVANTGLVIAPDATSGLFEPFRRLHDRANHDGIGLGLTIVASIAAMHRGKVAAQPRPGGGLTVTVTMPARPTAAQLSTNRYAATDTAVDHTPRAGVNSGKDSL